MAPPIAVSVEADSDTSAVTIPNPLTLESVAKRRAAQGKLLAGVAATADTAAFKGFAHDHKPRAKRWDRK